MAFLGPYNRELHHAHLHEVEARKLGISWEKAAEHCESCKPTDETLDDTKKQ